MTELCFVCQVGGVETPGVHQITDAEDDPDTYNGKWICKEHQDARAIMKEEPI